MKTKSYIAPIILMVLWALLNSYKPVSSKTVSSETPVAASATESPPPDQPSDDGPGVLTQVAEAAPDLEPPPSAAGPISYPVQAEAAATPVPALPVPKPVVVTQPVRTTYGQYYSCGPNGCSVVYPSQNYVPLRRGVFRRW
jgi:hypothetical protein